jgi:hypothetical protein
VKSSDLGLMTYFSVQTYPGIAIIRGNCIMPVKDREHAINQLIIKFEGICGAL